MGEKTAVAAEKSSTMVIRDMIMISNRLETLVERLTGLRARTSGPIPGGMPSSDAKDADENVFLQMLARHITFQQEAIERAHAILNDIEDNF